MPKKVSKRHEKGGNVWKHVARVSKWAPWCGEADKMCQSVKEKGAKKSSKVPKGVARCLRRCQEGVKRCQNMHKCTQTRPNGGILFDKGSLQGGQHLW